MTKKTNIHSKRWLELLQGDVVSKPSTRDDGRSHIKFTLEQCEVNKEDGSIRTVKSQDLKWQT